eukprot:gnl/MRDRNA2_/MRDRNA2_72209_c0_seq1.p1 gnl/MRDRNA2_/MRDRNA2_72209_c0~~gnl/MRDRNA2_/MRDRNA2_72209_c0_seq1.p1  ORF type:complete len:164 (-),score=24.93 gnl/MRDRNA2_/MRDRNA2_72209_c0_seq1:257-748(-)
MSLDEIEFLLDDPLLAKPLRRVNSQLNEADKIESLLDDSSPTKSSSSVKSVLNEVESASDEGSPMPKKLKSVRENRSPSKFPNAKSAAEERESLLAEGPFKEKKAEKVVDSLHLFVFLSFCHFAYVHRKLCVAGVVVTGLALPLAIWSSQCNLLAMYKPLLAT